uniref:Uncharacterized protein n=1 Tax=Peronospora matthiolae TaxID=2874970 RepID=A0AAV1U9K0_9STRA
MCWRGRPRETATGDGYEWICSYLSSCNGDLLEFDLDVDGQHFYDNLDLLPPYTPQPSEYCGELLELTPFVISVISKPSSTPNGTTSGADVASPISYCALLEEAQSTATTTDPSEGRSCRLLSNAVTTPRKNRTRSLYMHDKKAATVQRGPLPGCCTMPPTRSSSRKKLNRRLF